MKEGLRRIVRVLSIAAWFCLIAGIAASVSTLTGNHPRSFYYVAGAAIASFALIQGLAWVIAGFSGNEKGSDGLIRWGSFWAWRKPTTPIHAATGTLDTGRFNWRNWAVWILAWGIGWSVVQYVSRPADEVQAQAMKYFKKPENQREFIRIMGSIAKSPDYLAALKQSKPADPIRFGQELGQKGLPGLPEHMLQQRMQIFSRLLERSDTALCAKIVQGTTSGPHMIRFMETLETLPQNDVTNWLTLSRAAMEAGLKRTAPPALSQEQLEDALLAITNSYSDAQRRDLADFFRDPSRVTDAKACEIGRTLYKGALAAPEAKQRLIARALVSE